MRIVITCEHAGLDIPDSFKHLFAHTPEILQTHRGWDPGALEMAEFLSLKLSAPVFTCLTSRLLIEVNRSLHHPQLFSEFSQGLSSREKNTLINDIYFTYRNAVEESIGDSAEPVLHLSIHTFTPVLNNEVRELEIGLLFDPKRTEETNFSKNVLTKLSDRLPGYRIQFNEPYKGVDDGFTTYLRTLFDDKSYRGIEVEINQKLVGTAQWHLLKESLASCLRHY